MKQGKLQIGSKVAIVPDMGDCLPPEKRICDGFGEVLSIQKDGHLARSPELITVRMKNTEKKRYEPTTKAFYRNDLFVIPPEHDAPSSNETTTEDVPGPGKSGRDYAVPIPVPENLKNTRTMLYAIDIDFGFLFDKIREGVNPRALAEQLAPSIIEGLQKQIREVYCECGFDKRSPVQEAYIRWRLQQEKARQRKSRDEA